MCGSSQEGCLSFQPAQPLQDSLNFFFFSRIFFQQSFYELPALPLWHENLPNVTWKSMSH